MGEFNRSSSDNDNSPAQEGGSIRSECHQPDEYPLYEGSPFSTTQGCLVLVMILQVSANSTVFRSDTVEFLCTLTILKHTSGYGIQVIYMRPFVTEAMELATNGLTWQHPETGRTIVSYITAPFHIVYLLA